MCRVVLASRKLEQSWTDNLLQQPFSVHSPKGKEIETQMMCIRWETENLQKILERKVDLAVRGKRVAQQKMFEADADVEVRSWEKKFWNYFERPLKN